jgi:hypothetical protein
VAGIESNESLGLLNSGLSSYVFDNSNLPCLRQAREA